VSWQGHKPAVSLFCKAALARGPWAVGSAFSPEHCCSALMLGHCTPAWRTNLCRRFGCDTRLLVSLFCRAADCSGEFFLPKPVLQCIDAGSLTPVWIKICVRVLAVTQGFCEPVLQSGTEQWGVLFALRSAAVRWWWVIAHVYG